MAGADDIKSKNPYLVALEKRTRAARKKSRQIQRLEEAVAEGKPLDDEQMILLNSKPDLDSRLRELGQMRSVFDEVASIEDSCRRDPSALSKISSPSAGVVISPETKDASEGTVDTCECAATQTELVALPEAESGSKETDEQPETESVVSDPTEPIEEAVPSPAASSSVKAGQSNEDEVRELILKERGEAVSAAVSGLVQLIHVVLHYTARMQTVTGKSSPLPETLNFFGKVVLGQTASPEDGFAEAMQQSITDALKYVHGADKPVHVNGESYSEMSLTVQRLANELKALDLSTIEEPDINFFASPPPPPSPEAAPKRSTETRPTPNSSNENTESAVPGNIVYTAPHPGQPSPQISGDFAKQTQTDATPPPAGFVPQTTMPPCSMPQQNNMPPGAIPPGTMAQGSMPQAMAIPPNGLPHASGGPGPMSVAMQLPHGRIPPHPSMMTQEGQFYAPAWTSLHGQDLAHVTSPQEVAFTNGAPFYPANVTLQGGHWHHGTNANGPLNMPLPQYGFSNNSNATIDPAAPPHTSSSHVPANHTSSSQRVQGNGGTEQPNKLSGPPPPSGQPTANRTNGRQRRPGNRGRERRGKGGRGEGGKGVSDPHSTSSSQTNGHVGGRGGANSGEGGTRGGRHRNNGEKHRGRRPRVNGSAAKTANADTHEQGGEAVVSGTPALVSAREKTP